MVCPPKALAKRVLELIQSQLEAHDSVAEDPKNGVIFAEASARHLGFKR
jgi:hypothetical protein